MDQLSSAMSVAVSGMRAQSTRMRVVSENIANSQSTALDPNSDPYRRKVVLFRNFLERETGSTLVHAARIVNDKSSFKLQYEPNHPAANDEGYVKYPNINSLIESMDLREAQLSYRANINVMRTARSMQSSTIDLLR
ncbi:MAG: flagellar basal body rod protein FlgC [Pseudomonadota bacterium]